MPEMLTFPSRAMLLKALINNKQIFVKQPTGFEVTALDVEYVSQLNSALYGLRESGLLWITMVDDRLQISYKLDAQDYVGGFRATLR